MWHLCLLLAGSITDVVNGHLDAINRRLYLHNLPAKPARYAYAILLI